MGDISNSLSFSWVGYHHFHHGEPASELLSTCLHSLFFTHFLLCAMEVMLFLY